MTYRSLVRSVFSVLKEKINLRKVYARWILHVLTPDQTKKLVEKAC